MYVCMYVCMHVLCMYAGFGALIPRSRIIRNSLNLTSQGQTALASDMYATILVLNTNYSHAIANKRIGTTFVNNCSNPNSKLRVFECLLSIICLVM
jgi:hypothetical protein